MKIGILTFHCAHNYGAVLQAYALQEFLCLQGFDAYIIDYRPVFLERAYKLLDIRGCYALGFKSFIKIFFSKLLLLPASFKRRSSFNYFISTRLRLKSLDLTRSGNDFDAFVLGSDQIWNPKLCKGLDAVYLGDFKAAYGKRVLSYAASMGDVRLTEEDSDYIQKRLESFVAISVREHSLQQLLSPLIAKPIETVVDPTFLLETHHWEAIAVKPKINSRYVLVYQVVVKPETLRIARQIASQIGGIVVELKARLSLTRQTPYQYASPEQFLGFFKHASFVVTTSFHGTAFSLIFSRSFYTLRLNTGADTRSESLLNSVGLSNRMVDIDDFPHPISEIDYSETNLRKRDLVRRSEAFLLSALRKV